MNDTERKRIKLQLLKCAKENENKGTFTGYVIVSSVCRAAVERIEELEKENAELKADNDARKFAMAMSEKVEKQLREQLTKAKEIIREIIKYDIPTLDYEQAEQFLKEIEK